MTYLAATVDIDGKSVEFYFIGNPDDDKIMSPLYVRVGKLSRFAGYWLHNNSLTDAAKRGYAAWVDPGTYRHRA